MTYTELARKIKNAYKELRKDEVYKLYNVVWNDELDISEIISSLKVSRKHMEWKARALSPIYT